MSTRNTQKCHFCYW